MLTSGLTALSCGQANDVPPDPFTLQYGKNFKFYTGSELYLTSVSERSTDSAPFEIREVKTVQDQTPSGHDFLIVTVRHPDCTGDFEIVWNGAIMESYPLQMNIFLSYKADCNKSSATKETVLSIDLDLFTGNSQLIEETVFHVINGSKVNTDEDVSTAPVQSSGN
jgi:hypothetical protein